MDTALGELHLWHFGKFTLSRTEDGGSSVVGNAWFFIVGGTGDFEGATGLTYCVVQNRFSLPPPEVLPTLPLPIAVPFDYEFYGFISVRDVD